MSKLPFNFVAIPQYFYGSTLFKNPNTILFVNWAFSKCSTETRTIEHDHKIITLEPFEFITGRGKSSAECLLTEDAFKHQLNTLLKLGFLKKSANSTPNRFSSYIWVTERFSNSNANSTPNRAPTERPTERPQSRYKIKDNKKENHHPKVSSSNISANPKVLNLTDDLFFDSEDKEQTFDEQTSFLEEIESLANEISIDEVIKAKLQQHQVKEVKAKPISKSKRDDEIEVYPKVFMSQATLDACIAIKGSRENVETAVEFVMRSPGRKREIYDWPNVMLTWKIKPNLVTRHEENEKIAKNICKLHGNHPVFPCTIYTDKIKGVKYLAIQPATSEGHIYISLSDHDFKSQACKALQDRKMPLGLVQNADRVSLISTA